MYTTCGELIKMPKRKLEDTNMALPLKNAPTKFPHPYRPN
jgi:hypothetical protein